MSNFSVQKVQVRDWIRWNDDSTGSGKHYLSRNRDGMTSSYEAKYRCLFPFSWHVDAHLLQLFCDRTKEHVQAVLSRYETPDMVDVPLLVNALRTTMQFERVRNRRSDY